MSPEEYVLKADAIATKIGVRDGLHHYFKIHQSRILECCRHFGLLDAKLGDVLEIGPFYSYTPCMLRDSATSYKVIEGDDVVVYNITDYYETIGVDCQFNDLFQTFGKWDGGQLPYAAESFDQIICWETMEHFNFNPIPFVRELLRLLKPGGIGYLSVPNLASLNNRLLLLTGRSPATDVASYKKWFDQQQITKKPHYGHHWREYTLKEFQQLFASEGFEIIRAQFNLTFQNVENLKFSRKISRALHRVLFSVVPSLGKLCLIEVRKPLSSISST